MRKRNPIVVMVGPDINGLGGISTVVRLWKNTGLFSSSGVEYLATYSGRQRKLWHLLERLTTFLLMCRKNCKAVYIHTASHRSFYRKSLFLILGRMLRKPVVLHIHPTLFCDFVEDSKGLLRAFMLAVIRRAACLVVLSEEMETRLSALFPEIPIFILPNAVDLQEANKYTAPRREKRTLIFLGLYVPEKGVYDLVDAIKILIGNGFEVSLDFYGTNEIDRLRRYVMDLNLSQYITVNDWIGDSEKFIQLSRSAALVLPSYTEGMPNVVLEAMATKTPIIATRVGGLKELLRHAENAFVAEVRDPQDLSDKIRLCIENEEMRNRLAEAAYRDVAMKYDIRKIHPGFTSIMEWIQNDGKRSPSNKSGLANKKGRRRAAI
jgi:glycosyltransferase involved in cell wall biosynthesis